MKEQIRYSLKNILYYRKRKTGQMLLQDITCGVYLIFMFVVTQLYSTCHIVKKYELNQMEKKTEILAENQTINELLLFLSIIKVAVLIVLVGGILFGVMQTSLLLNKKFLIQQEELLTKILIGCSYGQITSEFIGEAFIMLPVFILIGLVASNRIIQGLFLNMKKLWPIEDIVSLNANWLMVTVGVIGVLLVLFLFILLFFSFQKKVKKLDPTFFASN